MASTLLAMPAFIRNLRTKNRRERDHDRSLEAYARLRKEGLQPARTKDAHRMEQLADHKYEMESGQLLPKKLKQKNSPTEIENKIADGEAMAEAPMPTKEHRKNPPQ